MPKNTKVICLNHYRPIALTSVAMKCFERLVIAHINNIILDRLHPLQFTHHPNRSIDDTISIHSTLPLDKRNTYVIMLFLNYNLMTKLRTLGLNTSLCNLILDFLTGRP